MLNCTLYDYSKERGPLNGYFIKQNKTPGRVDHIPLIFISTRGNSSWQTTTFEEFVTVVCPREDEQIGPLKLWSKTNT